MSKKWLVIADDPSISQQGLIDLLSSATSPRQRRLLEVVIEHDRAEIERDMEAVMSTVAAEPDYHRWTPDGDVGAKGREAVRAHYVEMFGRGGVGNLTVQRKSVAMDDHTILIEQRATVILPWQLAEQRGVVVPIREGHYACHSRIVTAVTFDDEGLIVSEANYGFLPTTTDCEPVASDELSPGYLAWLREFHPGPWLDHEELPTSSPTS